MVLGFGGLSPNVFHAHFLECALHFRWIFFSALSYFSSSALPYSPVTVVFDMGDHSLDHSLDRIWIPHRQAFCFVFLGIPLLL